MIICIIFRPLYKQRATRASSTQIAELLSYMERHSSFAAGKFNGPMGKIEKQKQWDRLVEYLNRLPGSQKTEKQWRTVYINYISYLQYNYIVCFCFTRYGETSKVPYRPNPTNYLSSRSTRETFRLPHHHWRPRTFVSSPQWDYHILRVMRNVQIAL